MISTSERLKQLHMLGMVNSNTDGMIGTLYCSDFNVSAVEISMSSDKEWKKLYSKLSAEKERRDNVVTNLWANHRKKGVRRKNRPTVKFLVQIEGGILQSIQCSELGAEAAVIDYDCFQTMDNGHDTVAHVVAFTKKVVFMGNQFSDGIKRNRFGLTKTEAQVKAYLQLVEALEKIDTKREDAVINAVRANLKGENMGGLLKELTALYKNKNSVRMLKESLGPSAVSKLQSLIKLTS